MNDHHPKPPGPTKRSSPASGKPAGSAKVSAASAAKASRSRGPATKRAPESKPPLRDFTSNKWRLAVAIAIPILMLAAFLVSRIARDEPTPTAAEDPLLEYCATVIDRDAVPVPRPWQAGSEEVEETVPVLAGRMVLMTEKLLAVAPKEAKAELETQRDAYRALVVSRDPAGFRTPALTESRKRVNAIDLEGCKLESVRFNATDAGYSNVPGTVKRGRTSLEMHSVGTQGHEMVLFRRNDEFPGDFVKILRSGKEDEEATRVASAYAAPGYTDTLVADLAGGDYALVCYVPSGARAHWEQGMVAEFTVR